MPPLSFKPAVSSWRCGGFDCKGGLTLMRDILVFTLCGGTAGLMIAIVGNAF